MALSDLLALQDHDILTEQVRHRRANLPEAAAVRDLELQRSALTGRRAELAAEQARLGHDQEALERDIDTSRAKQAELAKRLSATSVPREAQTLQHEIDTAHQRQTELEDRELELMEALEPIDAEVTDLDGRIAALEEQLTVARAELAGREAEVDAELATLAAAREPIVAAAGEFVASYEKTRTQRGGIAVARLAHGTCDACHMQVSSSELQRLRQLPAGEVAECENCGRMLVL